MCTKNQPKRMIITESGDFCLPLKGTVIENLKRHYSQTGYKLAKFFFQIHSSTIISATPISANHCYKCHVLETFLTTAISANPISATPMIFHNFFSNFKSFLESVFTFKGVMTPKPVEHTCFKNSRLLNLQL